MDEEMMKKLLALFAKNDYPITYQDGSHGLGMGYGDFEKMLKKLVKKGVHPSRSSGSGISTQKGNIRKY